MRAALRRTALVPYVIGALALAAGLAALMQLGWHAQIFAGRASFPLDLEWMEGGTLVAAYRIAAGLPVYGPPTVDFVPFLYTPLHWALLAALSFVFPLGYTLGRVTSLVALAGALGLVVLCAERETRGQGRLARAAAVGVGLAGAGAVVGGFAFTDAFYDIVRADSLLLFFEALALTFAARGTTWKSAALAGVAIALAFFTKQVATIVGIGIGVGLLAAAPRRGLVYGLAAAVVLGAGIGGLTAATDGWFWKYIFDMHQSHGFRNDAAFIGAPREIRKHFWPMLVALPVTVVGLALARRLARRDLVLGAAALAGIGAAIIGFGTPWAAFNAFIPALYFPAFTTAVFLARLCALAMSRMRFGTIALTAGALLLAGGQAVHAGKPVAARWRPSENDRLAAGRFLEQIRTRPGEGFIPFHPFYSVLVGKPPFLHRMGVLDVADTFGRPHGLDQALSSQRFSFVVLDWKHREHEFPQLSYRYRVVHEFRLGFDTVRNFGGADTWPTSLLVPVRDPPPLPAKGVRLADFEAGHWNGWIAEGGAFGPGPAPAPVELFGRFAADSGRNGPASLGTLRSPSLSIGRPRLRFHLEGPADGNLRVILLDGTKLVHAVSPQGATEVVEWDISAVQDRPLVLTIEDRSIVGAIAVDELVAY